MHWIIAVMIAALLSVGFYMAGMDPSDEKFALYSMHKSSGIIAFVLILIRICVRMFSEIPQLPSKISTFEVRIASFGVFVFYVIMLIMPISGYVMSMASGHPINLFNSGIMIPDLVGSNNRLASLALCVHEFGAFALISMIMLHILAALKHFFFDKINLFSRVI